MIYMRIVLLVCLVTCSINMNAVVNPAPVQKEHQEQVEVTTSKKQSKASKRKLRRQKKALKRKFNTLGLISLLASAVGIAAFFLGSPLISGLGLGLSIIVGLVSLKRFKSKNKKYKGKWMSKVGITLSIAFGIIFGIGLACCFGAT